MLMSPSRLPPACCSAPAGLPPEPSSLPAAVETTHQPLLAESQPAFVLLERHCITGLPAGGECVLRVCGECVGSVREVCRECAGSARGGCAGSVWGV